MTTQAPAIHRSGDQQPPVGNKTRPDLAAQLCWEVTPASPTTHGPTLDTGVRAVDANQALDRLGAIDVTALVIASLGAALVTLGWLIT